MTTGKRGAAGEDDPLAPGDPERGDPAGLEPEPEDDDPAGLAPRRRPGARTPPVEMADRMALLAAAVRGGVGVLALFLSMLVLPAAQVTPILAGVSILMLVSGASACWSAGRREPRLARTARAFVWGLPIAGIVVVALTGILGAGSLGPSWSALRAAPTGAPTVRFEPTAAQGPREPPPPPAPAP